jgi:hypothetical protein
VLTGVLLVSLWCAPAVAFSYAPLPLRATCASLIVALTVVAVFFRRQRRWALPAALIACVVVIGWYRARRAGGEIDWAVTQSRMPQVEFDRNLATIHDVRNFEWRSATDFTPAWEARTYDLDKLVSLDLVVTYWGSFTRIAHTCLSFGFSDGQYVHISVESRRQKGEGFNPAAGQFKRYGLIYVISDERDALGSRVLYFGERVHLYPTRTKPEAIRMLFVGMLTWADYLREHPAYYNTLFHNCTTTILDHIQRVRPAVRPSDPRIWLNGRFDQLCFEYNWIDTDLPFDETRKASRINDLVKEIGLGPDFSIELRARLHAALKPGRRAQAGDSGAESP